MAPHVYVTFLLAIVVIVIVPGPTVTLVVANSLRHGRRAGILNVLGTQLGIAAMVAVVLVGLAQVAALVGHWFVWIRLLGALYLVWLGWKLWTSAAQATTSEGPLPQPRGGFFVQGMLVALSNPKMLLFFGAFFPQFLDPARDVHLQIAIMGATAMAVAAISDSSYALLASRAGAMLSARRRRLLTRAGGGLLIGGGLWLALSRSK